MTIAIISHPDCLLHEAGGFHPERPDRVKVIQAALKKYAFEPPLNFYDAPLVTMEQLYATHDKNYVDSIFSIAPKEGVMAIDADTAMNAHTIKAVLRAAGAVILAVDLVMQDKEQAVFCNVRPPGHHAEHNKAMGFCFFNNVAVGVRYALDHYQLNRIAIIDFDVHHGNGTQDIFQNEQRVLYCSSFQHPFYPGYDAQKDNAHILSVPLAAGTNSAEFREKVQAAWFDKIAAFKPQLIFFSAGLDAHANDPLAEINLTAEDYVWLTKEIIKISNGFDCKVVSVLEGGYHLDTLAKSVPLHVEALLG